VSGGEQQAVGAEPASLDLGDHPSGGEADGQLPSV